MSDMKSILRDIGYFGVGAAAVIIEAGAKAGKALIRKGEKTLRDNQDTVDDLKRKAKDLGGKMKDAVEKATSRPEKPPVDASALSPEERAELRRQLDEADAACEEACCCEPCACGEACESAERPVAPDVIYHAPAEPEEPEAPENSING